MASYEASGQGGATPAGNSIDSTNGTSSVSHVRSFNRMLSPEINYYNAEDVRRIQRFEVVEVSKGDYQKNGRSYVQTVCNPILLISERHINFALRYSVSVMMCLRLL